MKRIVFHLAAIACMLLMHIGHAQAETVSPEAAKAKAIEFLSTGARKLPARQGVKRKAPAVKNVELAYTSVKDGKTCFYVYNNGNDGGFVIVGGDDAAKEILAYSDNGHFDYDKAPDNFKELLSQYAEQISLAKPLADNSQNAPKRTVRKTAAAPTVQKEDIPDLIQTTWDQCDPYNRAIPKLFNSNTGEEFTPPTGCVQTAVAQIMKYWNYPEHGTGHERRVLDYSQINGYNPGFDPFTPEFGTIVHNIDFESATYDWENMLDNYTGEETEEQIAAVAQLMYHAGMACNAVWGVYETTGATPSDGLKKHFGYSQKAKEINRGEFDDQTWEEIIYTELKLGRPVLYSGVDEGYTGHQYIVHGYSSEIDMYKVNWGWGGSFDCYCKLTPTSGSTLMGFENNQIAVIRLQPATMDSDSTLEYGDTFWNNGVKYSIISNVFHTVEVARPERTEPQYADTINIPATLNYQGNDYTVVGLGEECFAVMSNIDESGNEWWSPYDSQIREINLHDGLRYIGEDAFINCGNLEHIEIPNSITRLIGRDGECLGLFSSCLSLKDVTFPNSIKQIPFRCFRGCKNLERFDVPEGVSSIGREAFSWCEKLNILTLPSTLNTIDNYAFQRCNNLDILICKATTPPTIKSSYESPFTASAGSGYLLVPEKSIDLYEEAQYWKDWKNILPVDAVDISTLGRTVTIDNIEYKLLPAGAEVTSVSIHSVPKITIPDIITLDNKDYKVTSLGSHPSFLCDTIVLPQYLTTIKAYAFQYSWAKEINIPASVTAIGSYAFDGCNNLEKIILPESIKEIPEDCFHGCDNLYMVEIPSDVKTIAYSSFVSCPNLFTIVCRAEDVPVWNNKYGNYDNCVEGTLYVPSSSIDKYRSAEYWKEFRFIKSIDDLDEDINHVTVDQDGLKYRVLEHGAVVIGYLSADSTITISEDVEYDGESYPVVSIGASALSGLSAITTVHLPVSMHSILRYAFGQCQGLKDINLTDNIEYIGESAFDGCTNLQHIHIPDSLKVLGDCFRNTAIEKLIIPEGVESVERAGGSTFGGMASLKEIVIPSTVDMIRTYGYSISINPNTEKVYVLAPDKISGTMSGNNRQTTAYVPSEYLEQYRHENDADNFFGKWYFKEVLPIIPLTTITLAESELNLVVGNTEALSIDYAPSDASLQYVKWTSSAPSIVYVDDDGFVTAYKEGTATIYARSMYYSNLIDSCIVTVTPSSHKIAYVLDGETYQTDSITVGEAITLPEEPVKTGYVFTGWEGLPNDSIMPDQDLELTAIFKKLGDPNDDGLINITDIVSVISYILEEAPADFSFKVADVNGDGIINITDIVGIIDIILSDEAPASAQRIRRPAFGSAPAGLTSLEIVPFGIDAGTTSATVTLDLLNPNDEFTAFECDIVLPDGIDWAYTIDRRGNIIYTQPTFNAEADRTDANYHTLSNIKKMEDGSFKVMCYSMAKETFLDEEGAILNLPLTFSPELAEGIYEIEVANTVLTRTDVTDKKIGSYRASVVVGTPAVQSAVIYGDVNATAVAMINERLAGCGTLDLRGALAVDGSTAFTLNDNAVIFVADGMSIKNAKNVVVDGTCAVLTLTDGVAFTPSESFTAESASYGRTLGKDEYGTLVLPFEPDAATKAAYAFYELSEADGSTLTFDETTAPEAGTPYVIVRKDDAATFAGSGAIAVTAGDAAADGWTMKGTYETLVFTDATELASLYCLSGNQFKQAKSMLTMNPFRAYFQGSGTVGSITLRGNDGTTRILSETLEPSGDCYDLTGRRVLNAEKGVYIVNGKKVLK